MSKARRGIRAGWLAAVAVGVMIASSPAKAQSPSRIQYNLPAQDLGEALRAVARASQREIIFVSDAVRGRGAPELRGTFTIEEAIHALLSGSGLIAEFREDAILVRGRPEALAEVASAGRTEPEILVTGSRIRGAPPLSPTIAISRQAMELAGQADLGEVIRSIPQNFVGGQNPGLDLQGTTGSTDLDGASQANLRGLGPSATLTLLNGRRLAYSGENQGIDISSIPQAAIDRVEVTTDGASAIYGSDAVAGVVNVILRDRYDGLSLTADWGASTDGGNVQSRLTGAAGKTWQSGGVLVAGNYDRSTIVRARQRSYTQAMNPTAALYPPFQSWSALGRVRQNLGDVATFSLVALYNDRDSERELPQSLNGDYRQLGQFQHRAATSFLLSPSIEVTLPGGWSTSTFLTYGQDRSNIEFTFYNLGAVTRQSIGELRNQTTTLEANAEGPVASLPGGDIRLAVGGGYRDVSLDRFSGPDEASLAGFARSRDSGYAFGELFVPLVSPSNTVGGVNRLSLNVAVRYEDYAGFGDIFTPRIGLIYAPLGWLRFNMTWGRSFKTPTLTQLYQDTVGALFPASSAGGVGLPSTATALYIAGGNSTLRPERSTNWTITAIAEPPALPGTRLEITYFDIDYTNRIVSPINVFGSSLSNPVFAPFVTTTPSASQIDAALGSLTTPLGDVTGRPFNPAEVAAIIDSRLVNVARQQARGVDATVSYITDLGSHGSLAASLNASYLRLTQQFFEGQPDVMISGTIFNPPRWRGRGGLTWENEAYSIATFVNYLGPLEDIRPVAVGNLDSQFTVDLSLVHHIRPSSLLNGLDLQLTALNVFNVKPQRIPTTALINYPYDSANYSPLGRIIRISVTARW